MAIYVDALAVGVATDKQAKRVGARNGNQWCHMIADTTAELRAFAYRIGMRPSWIQHEGTPREHFDLTPGRRATAVALGAMEVDNRELVRRVQAKRAALAIHEKPSLQTGGEKP